VRDEKRRMYNAELDKIEVVATVKNVKCVF